MRKQEPPLPSRVPDLLDDAALMRVLAGLPEAIVVIAASGDILWGNGAAGRMFGHSLESIAGVSAFDLLHPDDLDFALLAMETVQEKEMGSPVEVRLRGANGWCLSEIVGSPLHGLVEGGVVLSIRDITERRKHELAIDDTAKFRSLVHNAASLMMLVSPDGRVDAVSGAVARWLGHDPDAVMGHPLSNLVVPDDHEVLRNALTEAKEGLPGAGSAPIATIRLRSASTDEPSRFQLTFVNLLDDPTVGAFVVSGHDVSSRFAAELELRNTLSVLTATLEATGDAILVVDKNGAVTNANRRFAEVWRLPENHQVSGTDTVATDSVAVQHLLDQLVDPVAFLNTGIEASAKPDMHTETMVHFIDGRVFDSFSQPQFVDGEIVGRVWCFREATERIRLEGQLTHQALHDPLTGLANKTLFADRVAHGLKRWDRAKGSLAVLFLDIDDFKTVNDSLGHGAGDRLLIGVTERLDQCVRAADTVARIGGDEFAVLVENAGGEAEIKLLADRILGAFKRVFTVRSANDDGTPQSVSASVSIGVSFATPGITGDRILRNADLAMYTAKHNGKGRFEMFIPTMHATALSRLEKDAALRIAVDQGEFRPRYQPIVELASGRIVAVEALARWQHPVRGELQPAEFLGLARETGLIADISYQILDQALADLRGWQQADLGGPVFAVSVNVSSRQLIGDGLPSRVTASLEANGIRADQLILEITESEIMVDTESAITTLTKLHDIGVRIAIDDFGTGYSSLAYLQRLPVDILKIDKSFVDDITADVSQAGLVEAIIRMAQTLGLPTIAEGVEHDEQRQRLTEMGCDLAQGFYFATPVSFDAISAYLSRETPSLPSQG